MRIFKILSFIVCIVLATSIAWAGGVEDFNAGSKAYRAGKLDQAIDLWIKALKSGELGPKNQGIVHYNLGRAWSRKGDYAKAVEEYTLAIKQIPDDADPAV